MAWVAATFLFKWAEYVWSSSVLMVAAKLVKPCDEINTRERENTNSEWKILASAQITINRFLFLSWHERVHSQRTGATQSAIFSGQTYIYSVCVIANSIAKKNLKKNIDWNWVASNRKSKRNAPAIAPRTMRQNNTINSFI